MDEEILDDIQTREFNIDDLNPAKYNPRILLQPGDPEFEDIKNSIDRLGYDDFIVVNVRDGKNVVVGGHQRLNCLKHMHVTKVECTVVDYDEDTEMLANITLNNLSGEWDKEKLRAMLRDFDASDFDEKAAGVDVERLRKEIGDVKLPGEGGEFDVDAEAKKPVYSRPGDLWHLGKHMVICGDSTLPETYERLMGDAKADLVLTDPPYGIDVEKTAGKILNDNLPDAEFYQFLLAAFSQMHEHLVDDGTIYVWHADGKGRIFRKAFKDAGFLFITCCIWIKDQLVIGRSPFQWQHEPCLVGGAGNGISWYGGEGQVSVWFYDRPKKSKDHPTTKPVPLIAYQMKNSTQEGDVVLDPFLGSGTTLIACCETGRVCRGNELDPKFVDVIVERYISWAGSSDEVFVERDGEDIPYSEVPKPS